MTLSITKISAVEAPRVEDGNLSIALQNIAKSIDAESVMLNFDDLGDLIDQHTRTFGALPIQQCAMNDYQSKPVLSMDYDIGECLSDSALNAVTYIDDESQF